MASLEVWEASLGGRRERFDRLIAVVREDIGPRLFDIAVGTTHAALFAVEMAKLTRFVVTHPIQTARVVWKNRERR